MRDEFKLANCYVTHEIQRMLKKQRIDVEEYTKRIVNIRENFLIEWIKLKGLKPTIKNAKKLFKKYEVCGYFDCQTRDYEIRTKDGEIIYHEDGVPFGTQKNKREKTR